MTALRLGLSSFPLDRASACSIRGAAARRAAGWLLGGALTSGLLAGGCGGDPSTVATRVEALSVWEALLLVESRSNQGQAEPCPDFMGTVTSTEHVGVGLGSASFTEAFDLTGCVSAGMLLDGRFEVIEAVDLGSVQTIYRGNVTTSVGVCYLDVRFFINSTTVDGLTGTLCGFPAEGLTRP